MALFTVKWTKNTIHTYFISNMRKLQAKDGLIKLSIINEMKIYSGK